MSDDEDNYSSRRRRRAAERAAALAEEEAQLAQTREERRRRRFQYRYNSSPWEDEEEDEGKQDEDEDEEEARDEEEEAPKTPRLKPVDRSGEEEAPKESQMTEAQIALEAARRKHEEEEAQRIRELEETRRIQREKEEEDLKKLKEKQERRKKEREEEERRMEEQKRVIEEQRKREEEEKRKKIEEERVKKQEEAERKKAVAQAAMSGGRNFVVEKKAENKTEKFGNVIQAKGEMSLTKDQLEDNKRKVLSERIKTLDTDGLSVDKLKSKAAELWQLIIDLETQKYDLETRHSRQEYDLKELNERQRQINRNKYLKKGLDPESAASTDRYPPKVQVASKYERRVDRRSYNDRKMVFCKGDEEDKPPPERPTIKLRDEKSWQTVALNKLMRQEEDLAEENVRRESHAVAEADEEEEEE